MRNVVVCLIVALISQHNFPIVVAAAISAAATTSKRILVLDLFLLSHQIASNQSKGVMKK